MKHLVLDNGAGSIKASCGIQSESGDPVIVQVPNCVARAKGDRKVYLGHELANVSDYGALQYRRAHERGYLTSWETEKVIWDGLFSEDALNVSY